MNPTLRFKQDDGSDYPDWENASFEEIIESIPTKKYQIPNTKIETEGKYPVLDQSKKYIAGYSNEKDKVCDIAPIIIFGDHTTIVKYFDEPFVIGADGTKILRCVREEPKFIYYSLESSPVILLTSHISYT